MKDTQIEVVVDLPLDRCSDCDGPECESCGGVSEASYRAFTARKERTDALAQACFNVARAVDAGLDVSTELGGLNYAMNLMMKCDDIDVVELMVHQKTISEDAFSFFKHQSLSVLKELQEELK